MLTDNALNANSSATQSVSLSGTGTGGTSPFITSQPVGQTVVLGASASFSATATGTPTLSYQWQYLNGSGVWKNWAVGTGYNTAAFTTLATTSAYNGLQIRVVVTDGNSLSTTSNAVTLTVNSPPVLTVQPVGQTVVLGASASFSATATGTPTLSYQWQYLNGSGVWKNWAVVRATTLPRLPHWRRRRLTTVCRFGWW